MRRVFFLIAFSDSAKLAAKIAAKEAAAKEKMDADTARTAHSVRLIGRKLRGGEALQLPFAVGAKPPKSSGGAMRPSAGVHRLPTTACCIV